MEAGSARPSRILVVDDEEPIRLLLAQILSNEGYDVTLASDGLEGIDYLESNGFDLVISDSNMPRAGGLQVVATAKRIDPQFPVLVISGNPSAELRMRLVGHPRVEYIPKPFDVEHLRQTVARLLER